MEHSTGVGSQIPNWTADAQAFVAYEQERAYRKIAEELGFGPDAAKAFNYLSHGVMPASHADPEKLKHLLGDVWPGGEASWQVFSANTRQLLELLFAYEPTSAFEDINLYRSMILTLLTLAMPIGADEGQTEPLPLVASLPSGDVNAKILVEPTSMQPIVFFEQGLFSFVFDFVLVISRSLSRFDPVQMDALDAPSILPRKLPLSPEVVDFLYSSVLSYVAQGNPKTSKQSNLSPDHNLLLAVRLVQELEWFIMAHELAHLSEGHLSEAAGDAAGNWKQEYAADAIAFRRLAHRAQATSGTWVLAAWACDSAVLMFQLLELALQTLAFGNAESLWTSRTHPPAAYRLSALRGIGLFDRVPSPSWPALQAFGDLGSLTNDVLTDLWAHIEPRLLEDFEKGARPSPLWRAKIAANFTRASERRNG